MLLLAAAAVAATPPIAPQSQSASPNCPRAASYMATAGSLYRGKPLTPHRLIELPDGNLYFTVYRRIDGCEVPVVVKYGVNRR